jgi:threonine/homoserine/homoserine lactone efflux protein
VIADLAYALAVGAALGAATGIPLGVVNVAVVEAAQRSGRRHATGIGIGGALADTVHAGLAFAGIAPLIAREPALVRGLTVVAALVILVYAVRVWQSRGDIAEVAAGPPRSLGRGVATGLVLTLPNPAPLLAWVAVASAVLPTASVPVGLAGALGVGVGSAAWFVLLAALASRHALRGRLARVLPGIVAILLVVLAGVAVARVFVD